MGYYPPALIKLIDNLARLPGIGRKTATRLALFLMRQPEERVRELADSLIEVKLRISFCSLCHNFTEQDPCPLCRDEARANGTICVVEGPGDLMALEATGVFKGRYHVLGGALSPLSGVGPGELRIGELAARIGPESVREVLLATSSGAEGEATANFICEMLRGKGVMVTRIARGVPMGAELEYVDEATLKKAIEARREA
ncbi:MAG: recombination mediator RecR [Proteobacteria bacterium]|nr:recombination mediator RecR [Pseudomonadota bacterium]